MMLSRRRFLQRLGATLAVTPVAPSLVSSWFSPDDFELLRRNVGLFQQRGGTIGWLASDNALVVVDTQYPESASDCWEGLQDRSAGALDLVINTHHHGDHVGGNSVFAPHTDRFVAHANVPDLMRDSVDDEDDPTFPTETFEDTWSESVGNETIALRHHGPAHTGGDAVIHFETANVMHVGDLVFNRAYPFIDVDGGASSQNWIEVLETIHETLDDETIVIHGHANPSFGPTGDRSDLLVMRDFLSALNEYVETQRQAGASLDEMKEIEVLDGFEEFNFDWALSLDNCIEAVHREQTA